MKSKHSFIIGAGRLLGLFCAVGFIIGSARAQTVNWRSFGAAANWSADSSWVGNTGPGVGGNTLIINFDAYNPGASTGGSGAVGNSINYTNDLGLVTLNQLNFAGLASTGGTRANNITGSGTLLFAGSNASINASLDGNINHVRFNINNDIRLATDLNINVASENPGYVALGGANQFISANTAGLKMITVTGNGNLLLAGAATTAIQDGSGQIGITMDGTGTLTLGSATTHNYSGGLNINSGIVVAQSAQGSGNNVTLGKTGDSAGATLKFSTNINLANTHNITVNTGGERVIEVSNNISTMSSAITLIGDLTLRYTGNASNRIGFAGTLSGAGNLILDESGGDTSGVGGVINLGGNNSGFTGNVTVINGNIALNSATLISHPKNRSMPIRDRIRFARG